MNCGLLLSIAIFLIPQLGLILNLPKSVSLVYLESTGEQVAIRSKPTTVQTQINITDISQLSTAPIDDPISVWALQLELLSIAEALIGPRDESYQLYQPGFYDWGPNIRFTIDGKGIYAELSNNGRRYWPTVVYELAHETLHMLNPGDFGSANYLEEGVAVAFSLYAQRLYGLDVQEPSLTSYTMAYQLVEALPGDVLTDAALIRREVGQFSNVTPEDLTRLFPGLNANVAIALACKLDRDAEAINLDTC